MRLDFDEYDLVGEINFVAHQNKRVPYTVSVIGGPDQHALWKREQKRKEEEYQAKRALDVEAIKVTFTPLFNGSMPQIIEIKKLVLTDQIELQQVQERAEQQEKRYLENLTSSQRPVEKQSFISTLKSFFKK